MRRPLVSVVIPFYNHRAFLARAVENMRRQTYREWEMILVDNNSSDGSREIALALSEAHTGQVRYIHQPVQGIPNARNKGLAEARGEYVSFLDVDDEFTPTKLADQVPILEAHPEVAMVYGLTRRVYLPQGRNVIQRTGVAREGVNDPPSLAIDWLKMFYHLPQTGATLVRTAVAREVGGFDESLRMGNDDVAYHLKVAFNYKVWFQQKEAVIYYRHEFSEGARLNRDRSVTERYFDAHQSWVMPYAAEYSARTGDSRPRYWAERALVNVAARLGRQLTQDKSRSERGRVLRHMLAKQRERGYLKGPHFRALLELHAWLPEPYAKRAGHALYKLLFFALPSQFPMNFRSHS